MHTSRPEDVQSIITGKLALKYAGAQVEAMQYIAKASQDRSVAEFEQVRHKCNVISFVTNINDNYM